MALKGDNMGASTVGAGNSYNHPTKEQVIEQIRQRADSLNITNELPDNLDTLPYKTIQAINNKLWAELVDCGAIIP